MGQLPTYHVRREKPLKVLSLPCIVQETTDGTKYISVFDGQQTGAVDHYEVRPDGTVIGGKSQD